MRAPLFSLLIVLHVAFALTAYAELPSIEAFFEPPLFENPRLSPSGKYVAVIVNKDDLHLIVTRELDGEAFVPIAQFSPTEGHGLGVLGFTRDPTKILVSVRRPRPGDPEGDRLAAYEYSLET